MAKFSTRSLERLRTCDPRLQELFEEVIKHYDCTVLEGHRGEQKQNQAYWEGKSKVKWPDSKHNKVPSLAIDVAPYPVDWENIERFKEFGAFVKGVAAAMGIKIRWGGDFKSFFDGPHFELVD